MRTQNVRNYRDVLLWGAFPAVSFRKVHRHAKVVIDGTIVS